MGSRWKRFLKELFYAAMARVERVFTIRCHAPRRRPFRAQQKWAEIAFAKTTLVSFH